MTLRLTLRLLLLTGLTLWLHAEPASEATILHLPLNGATADEGPYRMTIHEKGELAWVPGKSGQALQLDGSNGLSIRPAAYLHVGNQSWTAEAWIKPAPDQPNVHAVILAGGWGSQRQYSLRIHDNRVLTAHLLMGKAVVNRASADIQDRLFDGEWHKVALVIDRSRHGEVRLYLDGRRLDNPGDPGFIPPLEFEQKAMGLSVGAIAPWYLGKGGYVGGIDEIRVANAVLPAYAEDAPIEPPPPAPVLPVFSYDAARSSAPWTIQPESTLIATQEGVVEPGTAKAASLLQTRLRQLYGVTEGFDRISAGAPDAPEDKLIIALGPSPWLAPTEPAALHPYGYRIQRKDNVIVICGGQSKGTLYGAVRFLDEVAGIRFYMPGELFTSAGQPPPLTVGGLDILMEPFVRSAFMSGISNAGQWLDLNGGFRRLGGSHQHNMWSRFPPDRYADTMPEIYPIVDGERRIPTDRQAQDWNPCFSEPKLLLAAVDATTRYFQEHPDHAYIGFSIQDSHVTCQCERCLALYEPHHDPGQRFPHEPGHSIVYWRFMNALAARLAPRYPDKKIVGLAYASTRFVPPFKLHPNVIVFSNFHIAELAADKILIPGDNGRSPLDAWLEICDAFGNHDWYQGNGFVMPRSYTGYWSDFMKALHKRLPEGAYQHAECYPNWGLDGPKYWLLAQLWWHPDADVDRLWQQLTDDLFGPAAEPMLAYFLRLEQLWVTLDNVKGPERKLFRWETQLLTEPADRAAIAACRADLDRALTLAETDAQRQRIQLFAKTFRLTELLVDLVAAETPSADQLDEIRGYALQHLAEDPMTLYFSGDPNAFSERLDDILERIVSRK